MTGTCDKFNVGIVGCGFIGSKRAENLGGSGRLVACSDICPNKGKLFSEKYGCNFILDWRQLIIQEEVDIVVICTLHDSLSEIGTAAVRAGKHVLVEKPVGRKVEDLMEFIETEQQSEVCVRVGFNHRFHPALIKAKKIVDSIDVIDQDPELEILMTDLFDQFGIAIEELGDHCYYIKPDTVFAGDAFPGMREIGMSITFDRSSAMNNEQMTFISWDHPLVSTCIDLMLDGEQGSSSFGQILGTAAQAGLVAECTFLLEPVCPVSLGADRFLPPTPISVVVDHGGNDIKPNFDATKVREGNRKWLRSKIEILKKMVPVMTEAAEKLAQKDAVKNRKASEKKMEKVLEDTIDRLERLKRLGHPVRESELTEAQNERDALRVHLAKSRLRLDSIRLSAIGA